MRRSLETGEIHTRDAPLLNARSGAANEAGEIATRELRTPEAQAQQTAALAARNPNAIVALPPTVETLAVKAQIAEAITKRRQEQKRQRIVEHLFNGDGGPYQWHANVFETFGYALASGMAMDDAMRQASQNAPAALQILFAEIAAQVEQGVTLTDALKARQGQLHDIVVPIFEHGLIYGTAENAARQTAKALQQLAIVEAKFEFSALNHGFWMPLVAGGIVVLSLGPFFWFCANPLIPFTLFSAVMIGGSALGWKFRHKLAARKWNHAALSKLALKGWGRGFVRRQMASAHWSRTFAALWHCGVPISSALEVAGRSTRNARYERILRDAAQAARNGVSLGDSLARAGLLKGEMLDTIRTGEMTGNLGPALEQFANMLEDDAKERGGQALFLYTIGLIFAIALVVCILILIVAYIWAGTPMTFD